MIRRLVLVLFIVLLLLASSASANTRPVFSELQVKAVFLLNLTHFISWPASGRNFSEDPFTFYICGNPRFAAELSVALEGETIRGSVPVVIIGDGVASPHCDLLYIEGECCAHTLLMFKRVTGRPILTVGDTQDFCRNGGGVSLELKQRRIKLHVNFDIMRKQNLQVSSKLLQIATLFPEDSKSNI